MTDSDIMTRPPDAPPPGDPWKKIPGVKDFPAVKDYYEFSHRGLVRSLDHTTNGRFYEGTDPLRLRPDPDDYLVVNITMADGTRRNGVSVARLILLAHDPEGYEPGLQACHGPGGQQDNRWPENLRWGTDEENRADWRRDNPPKPKPAKVCVRCAGEFHGRGQRCRPCITEIGNQGADLIVAGVDLEAAAEEVGYPSAIGLLRIAVKHGGLRFVKEDEINAALRGAALQGAADALAARHPESRLRRVLFRREASRQDSDAQ